MIRPATPADVQSVYELVLELADYERLSHQVTGSAEDLRRAAFDDRSCHVLVAEDHGQIVGYAIYFFNFSTFLMKPGLYLEDVYVKPENRGTGIGKAFLEALQTEAKAKGCGRFEWAVLDWNQPAIDFYRAFGADVLDDWRICRVSL